MDLNNLWQWERKKLPCRIRAESGNPGGDDLREQLADLAGVNLQDLLLDMKNEKKKRETAKGKGSKDFVADKNFKEVLTRQHIIGGAQIALEKISENQTNKSQRNVNKAFLSAPKSPPRRISMDTQRELARPLLIPNKDEKAAAAAKLERRLQKQRAARMAAKDESRSELEKKKIIEMAFNGSASRVLNRYDGDLFSTAGDYMEGMLYLSRVSSGDGSRKKFIDMKRVLSEKAAKAKLQMSLSFAEDDKEGVAEEETDAPDITSKLHCAIQLCNWARNASSAQRLADEGAVRAIMLLCTEKVPRITAFCAVAFRFMSEQPVLANKMIDENSLTSILELIGSKTDEFVCANLAIALLNLTRVNGREGQLVEDSIVLCFLNIISHRQDLHTTCVRGLYNLTCVDTNYPLIERVIRALISLSSSGIGSVKHICAAALCNLADLKGVRLRMIEEGVISVLSNLARGAETRTRRVCAVILQNLTASKPCRNEMVSRNCVQVCYGLSSDQDPIILRCIGLTLSRLALEASNSQRIINDGGIMALCNIAVKYPTIPGISQPVAVAFQLMSSRADSQVAIVQEGSVTAVASLLRLSQDVFTLQYGLLALCNLLSSSENHLSIVQQGLMSTLVSLSVHTNTLLKDFCALAFFNLSCAEESRKHIVNAGAIQAIINTCESESKLTKRRCAASLCNITTYESGIRRMVSDGIIPALSKLLTSNDVETIRYSCAALCRLCSSLETGKLIMESGSMSHIIAYAISGDHINRQFCCAIISVLSYYEPCRIPLCELGAIEAIKSLADLNDDDTKKRLLVAFANLSCTASLQQKMVDEGVVAIIAKLVDSYQELNQVCCARALCNLACSQPSRRRIVEEGGVAALMMVCMVRSVVLKTKELCMRALLNLLEDGTVAHLLQEGVVDAVSSMAKLEDPAIVFLCAQLFNRISTYEQGRVVLASRSSYLRSIFAVFNSSSDETKMIIARSCCNLIYSSSPEVLDKVVAEGVLDILGAGASLDDLEASMQAVEAIFLLSQQARFTSTLANSPIPQLLCSIMEGLTSYDQEKAETCIKVLANLTAPFETRKLLQNPEFLKSFLRAISGELNDHCIVWVAQIIRYLVFGYPNNLEIIDAGLLSYINKLCDVPHPTVTSSVVVVLRELCRDERCLRALSNSSIVSLLSKIVSETKSAEVQYGAAVVLYECAKLPEIRQRLALSYQSDLVDLMIQLVNTKNIECVEILSAVFYYVSYDFKSRPALMTARAAPLIALIIDQEPSHDAIGNVLVGVFALTKMPACRSILEDAQVDKLLQRLITSQNSKTKTLSGNALKNLSSDANESIEEGAVAALISMSLEGKGLAGKSDDNFIPPVIAKADAKQSSVPTSFDNTALSKYTVSTAPWHLEKEATPGDFASKGPPAPEPPELSSENSADFPSMIEDLDAGETEGRTKMSFAKMQVPSEVRNAYLFDEQEYDIRKTGEEEEAAAEESKPTTAGEGDFTVLALEGVDSAGEGFEAEASPPSNSRPNSRGSKLLQNSSGSKSNLAADADRRKSRRTLVGGSSSNLTLPPPKQSQHSPKASKKEVSSGSGATSSSVDLPQVSMEQKAAQLRLYS